jgi:DNA-binding PadR family transcriptional regulator
VRLSTTSYVVLGMIAQRGPSTPYELKQAIAGSVGQFWHFPHAQLYSEPDRLSAHGLLDRDVEGAGRRRKTYTLTEPGRAALRRWLASPTEVEVQMRDIAELKLFFTEAGDPADAAGIAAALAAGQVAQHQRRIAALEQMVRRLGGDADADPGA